MKPFLILTVLALGILFSGLAVRDLLADRNSTVCKLNRFRMTPSQLKTLLPQIKKEVDQDPLLNWVCQTQPNCEFKLAAVANSITPSEIRVSARRKIQLALSQFEHFLVTPKEIKNECYGTLKKRNLDWFTADYSDLKTYLRKFNFKESHQTTTAIYGSSEFDSILSQSNPIQKDSGFYSLRELSERAAPTLFWNLMLAQLIDLKNVDHLINKTVVYGRIGRGSEVFVFRLSSRIEPTAEQLLKCEHDDQAKMIHNKSETYIRIWLEQTLDQSLLKGCFFDGR